MIIDCGMLSLFSFYGLLLWMFVVVVLVEDDDGLFVLFDEIVGELLFSV